MTQPLSGRCLCGSVRFTAVPKKMEMDVCHCDKCRRWSAGPFMGVMCGTSVKVGNEAALRAFTSSEWAERLFCGECGTTLFWRMRETGETSVSMNAFEDLSGFTFTEEIFIDEKPAIYAFANATHKMTGAEVFAAFAVQQGN
jgi:hypothetical protein